MKNKDQLMTNQIQKVVEMKKVSDTFELDHW